MARGKGLEPGKGLQQGGGLARTPMARTPMKRSAPSKPAPPARRTGASSDVRAQAIARDGGRCQRCGKQGTNLQHREGRGTGGRGKADAERTNGVEWLVLVCGQGNTSGCHREIDLDRTRSEPEGYVIRRNGLVVDAATVPVLTFQGWRLLTATGDSVRCDAPESH